MCLALVFRVKRIPLIGKSMLKINVVFLGKKFEKISSENYADIRNSTHRIKIVYFYLYFMVPYLKVV